MKAVWQRVDFASVEVEGKTISKISKGALVLLGVEKDDNEKDAKYIADKICNLRVFDDEDGKLNKSLIDISGELLIVSQFTLCADCRKGRRPSFINALKGKEAENLYLKVVELCKGLNIKKVETGIFGAHMKISLLNNGPVTLLLDSRRKF